MEFSELDAKIRRLAVEGVVVHGNDSSREGISPFLARMPELEHLRKRGSERNDPWSLALRVNQLVEQWQAGCPPLFAVTGLKNAGKSSLVKSFLSERGRKRTPTGLDAKFATRRYVFWLPDSSQRVGERSPFEHLLKVVFGDDAERLSSDPRISSQQYREDVGNKGMTRPLIAYDRSLDDWNIGIVDCPDIETGDGQEDSRLTDAERMLKKVSRLCAAFVVMGQYENLECDMFWKILRLVRKVGQKTDEFLVVNKCPPKPASELHGDLIALAKRNCHSLDESNLYASYNFTSKGSEKFAVRLSDGELPPGCATGDDDHDKLDSLLPTFFRCSGAGPHPPQPIPKASLLQSKVQTLSSAQLKRRLQVQTASNLEKDLRDAKKEVVKASKETSELITKSYRTIAKNLLEAMSKDGSVSPLQNHKLAKQQIQMLIDEAPVVIRLSMRATNWVHGVIADSADYVNDKVPRTPRKAIREGEARLKRTGTKLTAKDVADDLCKCGFFARVVGQGRNAEVEQWVTKSFEKFSNEFDKSLESLRPLVRQHYEQMNWKDYALAHAWSVGMFAALIVAASMIAIDGGASLYGISVLEGLLITGGTAGAQLMQTRTKIRDAEKPLIESQLAYLTAEVATSSGLPPMSRLDKAIEVTHGQTSYRLPAPPDSSRQRAGRIQQFSADESFLGELLSDLQAFQRSAEACK